MDRSSGNKKSKFKLEPPPTLAAGQTEGLGDITQTNEILEEKRRPKFNLTIPDMAIFDREAKPIIEKAPIVAQGMKGDLGLPEDYAFMNLPSFEDVQKQMPTFKQAWDDTGKMVQGISNFLVGEWLGNPERVYNAFASGDKEKIYRALDGMAGDMTWQVMDAMTLKMGQMARGVKPALKLIQDSLDKLTPRQAMQQVNKVIPGFMSSQLHSAWEVISSPIQKGVHKAVSARVLPSFEGPKSLADVFQPAVERLESSGLDVPFRRTSALKAVASERGKELGKTLAGMSLKGRYEVYKYFRGLPAAAPEKRLLEDWKHSFMGSGGMEREFVHSFRKTLKEKMKDEFLLSEDAFFHLPSAENFVRTIDQSLKGPFDAKAVQKALKGVIEDVNTPQELKFLARDLYNLPHSTPSAVANASKDASVTFLTNSLKRMGVVQDTLPKGAKLGDDWWISKFPKLKDSYVPRDVELELRAVMDIPKLMSGNGVLAKMNRMLLSPWKTSKLILMPAAHFRNTMSNFILNDWGGLPFYRMDIYKQAAQELKSKGKLFRELQRETGMGGSFSVAEIEQVTGGMKYGANGLDHALSLFDRLTSVPRNLYNVEEQWFKMAKYIWNKKQGMANYEAAMDAMKWTFNYGEITRTTAAIRGTAAPFFTWTSKVIPLMAETAMKHPIRFAKWPLMFQGMQAAAIENQNLNDQEWKWLQGILPEYIKEGAFYLLPFRDSKNRLQMLNMTYVMPGLGDMTEILSGPATHFLGSPFLTMGADILRNKTFMGTPVYYDWETPGAKFSKIMAHVWQGIVPNFPAIPGTIDFDKLYDIINNTPDAMTWGQMAASQIGLRSTPINPGQMARSRQALDDIHRAEIGSQMRRDLRKATSPKQAQAVVEHYSRLRERLERGVSERYQ